MKEGGRRRRDGGNWTLPQLLPRPPSVRNCTHDGDGDDDDDDEREKSRSPPSLRFSLSPATNRSR